MDTWYVIVRNQETGEAMLFSVPPESTVDVHGYIRNSLGEGWVVSTTDMPGISSELIPGDPQTMAEASKWINDQNVVTARGENPDTPIPSGDGTPQLTSVEQQSSDTKQAQEDYANRYILPDSQSTDSNLSGLQLSTPDGTVVTPGGYAKAESDMWSVYNAGLGVNSSGRHEDTGYDIYGNPINIWEQSGVPQPTPTAIEPTVIDDPDNPERRNARSRDGGSTQPYDMTHDNVELHSIFNKGGTNDDIANYYINNNDLRGSMSGDFAANHWDYYDDLWALQNPGMAMPDQMGQYGNASQYMSDMSGPIGMDGIGVMDGYGLWDSQFSDDYMGSERGMGSGDSFDEISASQYNQVMTNIQAMTPSMGSQNAGMIMNMVDRSYDDYRQLQLTGNSVNGVSFLQYLKSIGAEDWF